ncbi:ATP synthase subunit beta, mitochondrial [Trifolium repens]|nr:ATP synthase subunit beta, mitochondrial [Trifolium repens]
MIQNFKRGQDRRQTLLESNVNDGTNNLTNMSDRAFTSELISDFTTTGNLLFRRRRRWSCGGCGGSCIISDTIQKVTIGGSTRLRCESRC